MQRSICCVLSLMFLALATLAPQGAEGRVLLKRQSQSQSGPTTGMTGLEGEACSADEYERYKTIVCAMAATCQCGVASCALDWCHDFVHTKKKEFAACSLKGCP
mmetsp:Transcript_143694/g.250477  ORF Transcript_143694/g.250477 Transcript_143694/m.250477 type:complete len:104 (-) Transcript_143694:52-363(-)